MQIVVRLQYHYAYLGHALSSSLVHYRLKRPTLDRVATYVRIPRKYLRCSIRNPSVSPISPISPISPSPKSESESNIQQEPITTTHRSRAQVTIDSSGGLATYSLQISSLLRLKSHCLSSLPVLSPDLNPTSNKNLPPPLIALKPNCPST